MNLKSRPQRAEEISMPRPASALSDERGYTLVELMVAALVLIIGVLGTFQLLDGANKSSVANNARMGATNLAREILEDARALDYKLLTPAQWSASSRPRRGGDHVAVDGQPGAASPTPSPRRSARSTTRRTTCPRRRPRTSARPRRRWRRGATNLPVETQPDDFRRVTLTHQLGQGTGARSSCQTSLINNPSGGLGPRITKFDRAVTGGAQFTSGRRRRSRPRRQRDVRALGQRRLAQRLRRFDRRRDRSGRRRGSSGPRRPRSTRRHRRRRRAVRADTVLDGVYLVTAQAFDDRGVAGDSRAQTLVLNRSLPLTVQGFVAGYNELPTRSSSAGSPTRSATSSATRSTRPARTHTPATATTRWSARRASRT